jgi:hypothetical protein
MVCPRKGSNPMFIHVVFFWCKPGTSESVKQDMIRYYREEVPKVATVKQTFAGKAVASPRDVVDSSYDVGLCVIFDDKAGHDFYQTHKIHLAFVSRFQDHWARVRVQDFQ